MIMLKLGINRALWLFGLVQMVTIGGFIWLSAFGHFDVITSAELWKLGVVDCSRIYRRWTWYRSFCGFYGA